MSGRPATDPRALLEQALRRLREANEKLTAEEGHLYPAGFHCYGMSSEREAGVPGLSCGWLSR